MAVNFEVADKSVQTTNSRTSFNSSVDGMAEAERFLLTAILLIRFFLLAEAVVVALTQLTTGYSSPLLMASLVILLLTWSGYLGRTTWKRGAYGPVSYIYADVAINAFVLITLGLICLDGGSGNWTNWAFPIGLDVAIGVGIGLKTRAAAIATTILLTANLVGIIPGLERGDVSIANVIGDGLSFATYVIFGGVLGHRLRRIATRLDAATLQRIEAERQLATEEARFAEREVQYRRLHDTVLATLTLIARGALDSQLPAVRDRCARDANLVRQLIGRSASHDLSSFEAALSTLVKQRTAEGLKIHYRSMVSPRPGHAATDALVRAVGEALTNMAKHAGTNEAWVTVLAGDREDQFIITVADRGCGGAREVNGGGLALSIRKPVEAAGGRAIVTSSQDEGTAIEIRWPD